jgi:UDP-N-acetylmuramoyl-tripeptide--D-alanyl-D-alanine ligase
MLELGTQGPALHESLAQDLVAHGFEAVFAAGPLMRALAGALPKTIATTWREKAADLQQAVLDSVHAGDVVVVKGSNGSRMAPIVGALKERHAAPALN